MLAKKELSQKKLLQTAVNRNDVSYTLDLKLHQFYGSKDYEQKLEKIHDL